jgi:hypothetical protein
VPRFLLAGNKRRKKQTKNSLYGKNQLNVTFHSVEMEDEDSRRVDPFDLEELESTY